MGNLKLLKMPLNKKSFERYKIINKLLSRGRGYSVVELTELVNEEMKEFEEEINGKFKKLQVDKRMIRFDLEDMPNHYPVNIVFKKGRVYYESPEDSIDNINIKENDKNLIEMALQTLSIYQGSPLFEKFNDVINRIMASSVLRKISKKDSGKYIQISEMYGNTGQEWLEKIYNAISEKQTLVIHYESFGNKASIRTISPYQLREFRNKWYMIAHAKEIRNENKTILFKLSRIQKIDDCYEDYFIDQKFNSTDYFKHSLGVFHKHDEEPINVKLKINGGLMKLISEDKIHHSMVIESKTEKEMIVTFKVYNSPELETLILGYGNNCKVLEPQNLLNKITEKLVLNLELYKDKNENK